MLSRIDSGRPAMIAECPDCAQAKGVVEESVGHGNEPRCAQWCVLSIAARGLVWCAHYLGARARAGVHFFSHPAQVSQELVLIHAKLSASPPLLPVHSGNRSHTVHALHSGR